MSGSKEGGAKARDTIKQVYGEDYYARIGQMGGKIGRTGGFASLSIGPDGLTGKQRARIAGKAGGKLSRKASGAKPH